MSHNKELFYIQYEPKGCTIYFQFITVIKLTYFEQAYCSSSGGTTLYIQQLVYVMHLC